MSYYGEGAFLPDDLPPMQPEQVEFHTLMSYFSDLENAGSGSPDRNAALLEAAEVFLDRMKAGGYQLIYNYGDQITYDPSNCGNQLDVEWRRGDPALIWRPGVKQGNKVVLKAGIWSMASKDNDVFQNVKQVGKALQITRNKWLSGKIRPAIFRRFGI